MEMEVISPEINLGRRRPKPVFYILGAITFLVLIYFLFFSAPKDFPSGSVTDIAYGASLRSVSLHLKDQHVIRSRILFEAFAILYRGEKHIISGKYLFEAKLPVWGVARRVAEGRRGLLAVKVTIPEGFDISQTSGVFASKLINFNQEVFLSAAQGKEGYLFPDTYFFFNTDTEADVVKLMSENFKKKTAPLAPEVAASGKTEKEIIIMASVIEREAKGDSDRGFISGILWKRLSMGMPLQVDAAPVTYEERGLPASPVANPGLLAIKAAIHPISSSYLYYLHDADGNIHYAKSFEEHKANIRKYFPPKADQP